MTVPVSEESTRKRRQAALSTLSVPLALVLATLVGVRLRRYSATIDRLRENESMYRVLTENAYDWQTWLGPDGRIRYMSPSAERVTGYARGDFERDPDLLPRIIHPADRALYRAHLSRHDSSVPDAREDQLTFRIIAKGGDIRWLHHRCHPVLAGDGAHLGRLTVVRDETVARINQNKIEESAELSLATIESSADHIAVLDRRGIIQMVNSAWAEFGSDNGATQSRDDWVGVNYLDICANAEPPSHEGAHAVHAGLHSVIDQRVNRFEYEYPCHSATAERWFLLRAVPLRYRGGGALVSHTDITEMKLAQRELMLAVSSFETSEAIVITDAHTRIQRVNKAFTLTTGYDADEVVGKTPTMLQSGRHPAAFYADMWTALKKAGIWEGEIWNRRKSGEVYPERLRIRAICNDLGEVTHYIGSFSDISNQKRAEATIHHLAFYDPLTELPNKQLFMERLGYEVAHARRAGHVSALLVLNVNNLKLVNDSLGQRAGDEILSTMARRISGELRQGDLASRLGGDEFAMLISAVSPSLAKATDVTTRTVERILDVIRRPYTIDGKQVSVSARAGIDVFPTGSERPEDSLQRAYNALHRAEDQSGRELVFYQEEMQEHVKRVFSLQNELRQALTGNEFVLFYQGKVDRNGQPYGAEALIRWQHPERGLLAPGHFMDVVENGGLMDDVGAWVLATACAHIGAMQRHLPTSTIRNIAVNVSSVEFKRGDFVTAVEKILDDSAIDPSWLELEITESVILHDVDDAIDKMNRLRRHGIRWSIDDFGTGFSSLSYLKDLPFHTLKIDRSFVSGVHGNPKNQAIVRAIVSMAHNLDLLVVAEGVEQLEEFDFLRSIDCDFFQGYYFGRPAAWPDGLYYRSLGTADLRHGSMH